MDRDRLARFRRDALGIAPETEQKWAKAHERVSRVSLAAGDMPLFGPVVDDTWAWLYDEDEPIITPARVKRALDASEGPIRALLNSGGGDLWAGVAVGALFDDARRRGREVEMSVGGIAASAATVIMMRGGRITADRQAEIMIHLPMTYVPGGLVNRLGIAAMRENLDRVETNLTRSEGQAIALYAERNRKDLGEERIREMVERETWMTAEDAADLGFLDEVLGAPESGDDDRDEQMSAAEADQAAFAAMMEDPWEDLQAVARFERRNRRDVPRWLGAAAPDHPRLSLQ